VRDDAVHARRIDNEIRRTQHQPVDDLQDRRVRAHTECEHNDDADRHARCAHEPAHRLAHRIRRAFQTPAPTHSSLPPAVQTQQLTTVPRLVTEATSYLRLCCAPCPAETNQV